MSLLILTFHFHQGQAYDIQHFLHLKDGWYFSRWLATLHHILAVCHHHIPRVYLKSANVCALVDTCPVPEILFLYLPHVLLKQQICNVNVQQTSNLVLKYAIIFLLEYFQVDLIQYHPCKK